jgi:hypothetical protein
MRLRYVFVVLFIALEAPIIVALLVGALAVLLVLATVAAIATSFELVARLMRGIRNLLRLLGAYFRIQNRWVEFVPPVVVAPVLTAVLFILRPGVPRQRGAFVSDYSSFLQTAAQVLAALLIALALEARASMKPETEAAVRPAILLTVILLAVAELAAMAGLTPFMPSGLYRLEVTLTIAAGVAALLAVALVTRRILPK